MGRRRVLSAEQARAVVAEASRGVDRARIAKYFGVSTETIGNVIRGRTYGDVTGLAEPHTCPRCEQGDVADDNIDRARGADVEVECISCHALTRKRVGAVLNARGRVRCEECARRRK